MMMITGGDGDGDLLMLILVMMLMLMVTITTPGRTTELLRLEQIGTGNAFSERHRVDLLSFSFSLSSVTARTSYQSLSMLLSSQNCCCCHKITINSPGRPCQA